MAERAKVIKYPKFCIYQNWYTCYNNINIIDDCYLNLETIENCRIKAHIMIKGSFPWINMIIILTTKEIFYIVRIMMQLYLKKIVSIKTADIAENIVICGVINK